MAETKKPIDTEEQVAAPPKEFKELVQAYSDGKIYSYVAMTSKKNVVTFSFCYSKI